MIRLFAVKPHLAARSNGSRRKYLLTATAPLAEGARRVAGRAVWAPAVDALCGAAPAEPRPCLPLKTFAYRQPVAKPAEVLPELGSMFRAGDDGGGGAMKAGVVVGVGVVVVAVVGTARVRAPCRRPLRRR